MEKCHSKGIKVATIMFTSILLTTNVYVCMYIHNMYIYNMAHTQVKLRWVGCYVILPWLIVYSWTVLMYINNIV